MDRQRAQITRLMETADNHRDNPRGQVLNTSVQESQQELGPPWLCSCGRSNKQSVRRCADCSQLQPDERERHSAKRAQQAALFGEVIGKGGGYFQRQRREIKEPTSDSELDVFGRRHSKKGSSDSAGERQTKADKQQAALARLRAARPKLSPVRDSTRRRSGTRSRSRHR